MIAGKSVTPMSVTSQAIELLVRRRTARSEEFVQWAMDALVADMDSPALRRLAGLERTESVFEAIALFDRAALELNLPLPNSEEALLREYLRVVAADIVNGARDTEAALETIHGWVLCPLGHPEDLMDWCYLWEGLQPKTFANLKPPEIETAVRALAKRTLNKKRAQ